MLRLPLPFDVLQVKPVVQRLKISTDCRVPKVGVMLVGWGGNNGTTLTAALEANRRQLSWRTRTGVQQANWFGSLTQASTVLLGSDESGQDVFAPMRDLLPMINPDDIGEWWAFGLLKQFALSETHARQFSMAGTSVS